mmetsp:Transcript_85854/g.228189  ORF Transcript_85854/g.228189 Transcript_85854/m.228189 type:complete len:317 (-) Transcript_85854:65-1015(-)
MAPTLDNAGVGFALVTAAGLSTALGAAAVYNYRLVRMANKPVLAAGLGFSGGVMLYVSFVEIFVKSLESFKGAGESDKNSYFFATLCLFCGMLIMRLIALLVHCLDKDHHCHGEEAPPAETSGPEIRSNVMGSTDVNVEFPGGLSIEDGETKKAPASASDIKKLQRMGLNTAVAIAIHNFPEGLATFVATLADPSVGATLAIAIAIHNIPEGLCVALPIYYATNNRHLGFFFALLSGISEPIGAFIGWLIFKSTGDDMSQKVYGALFGLVGGMMIMIVLLELLPTGYRYDPQDKYVTNSLVLGMLVMALSLVLFQL